MGVVAGTSGRGTGPGEAHDLGHLLGRAFRRGPGTEANALITRTRDEVAAGRDDGASHSYEVVLMGGRGWAHLLSAAAPRLALFAREKHLSLGTQSPLFISLFYKDEIYFIRASDFMDAVRQRMGLDAPAFEQVVAAWSRCGRAAVGSLPPGPSPAPGHTT